MTAFIDTPIAENERAWKASTLSGFLYITTYCETPSPHLLISFDRRAVDFTGEPAVY